MNRKVFLILALLGLSIVAPWGCGGGPGSPGSQNTEDLGVQVDVISFDFSKNTDADTQTSSVDAFRETCSDGKPEPFRSHAVSVTFDATLLNPNTTFQPGTLYIESYTVTYRRKDDSIGAPPIESYTGFQRITIVPPTGTGVTSVTAGLMFVDLGRKERYANDMLSGLFTSHLAFINNYTATYTFEGQNEFGKHFTLTGQTDFEIGDFANCP